MSNSKNILYLISLILLMLTGCEADSSLAPFPNEGKEPVEVRFHAISVGASVDVSRAENHVEKIALVNGDQIGIWNEFYPNISLTYTENGDPTNLNTTNNEIIYYPLQTEQLNVYAYAPYSETETNLNNKTVNVRSEWEDKNAYKNYITDPLWASATITKTNRTAIFQFQHQMARLKINLINVNQPNSYEIMLVFDRTQRGTMNLENGNIEPSESNGEYKYYIKHISKLNETIPKEYDYTILPGTVLKEIDVQYSEEGSFIKKYNIKVTEEDKKFQPFVSGRINKINIDFARIK
ncbi:MAG: fimbrillin family protein [Bacteroides sp.]|nr:fimbrillin family protein [Bacteroides sp.]